MKTVNVNINIKPLYIPVSRFESLAEVLAHVNGDESKIVDVVSNYGQQKDSLVDGREFISTKIVELYKFPRLTTTVKVDGVDTQVDDDTDNDHVKRFIAAVAQGTANSDLVSGTTVETRQVEISTILQKLINDHGPFTMNLNAAQRSSKPKEPADYALKAATGIIAAKAEKVWVDRFTKGHGGVPPTAFESFTNKAAKDAKAENHEAVKTANIRALAFAIMAREKAKSELAKAEYSA